MQSRGTLLLGRSEVASLLSLEECIEAVERVFRWQGEGNRFPTGIPWVLSEGQALPVRGETAWSASWQAGHGSSKGGM